MSVSPEVKDIWDLIKENQKGLKQLRESQKETSEQMKRNSFEVSEKIKETNEGLKQARTLFETQWGKLIESLVEGNLVNILNEQGIKVINTNLNIKHRSEKNQYE